MKFSFVRCGMAALVAVFVAGCGGGGSDATTPPVVTPPPAATVLDAVKAAAALAANDTAINSTAPFTVLQSAGVPAVTVNSPPKVNFALFSDGAIKSDLKITNVSLLIAKLVPGSSGNPDQWVSYTYRKETAAANVGPNGKPVLASAMQATSDGKQTDPTLLAAQLVYNTDGYYTYTFKTDIKDPAQTNGVMFEPNRTHRVAIQLSYTNAAGETIRVNPYFDFTIDANGKSVAITDPSKTRKMTDVTSCNSCHDKLALHGGGRVDTQFCVMCHNPGTTDANSGNVLTLSTMVHKIHAGRSLKHALDAGKGGEDYVIWGYSNSKHDYAEVGFPQDLRNCAKCHTSANPNTPQGDNWKTKVSKEACLTCHANKSGSVWHTSHTIYASAIVGAGAAATDIPNEICAACHKPGSNISPERVHFNQAQTNGAKYKMNIESTSYDAATRMVSVKYFLSDPTNGDKAYKLVTPDCTGTTTITCANTTQFGNLRFYLAYQNMVGQSTAITEFSAYNNGGNSANVYAYKGVNDGNNHYTVQIAVPADTATAVAAGTARVVSIGQVKEPELVLKSAADPRPEVSPRTLVNVVVQNTYKDLALTGTLNPRRAIVSNEKCNACHGMLGTTSGSNTLVNAFHGGARNTVEACAVCHDANRMSSSTFMTNGLALNESYHFKRMIHGIHGGAARTYAFTHGNKVVDAFGLNGNSLTGGAPLSAQVSATTGLPLVTNFSTEVAWPGPTAIGAGIDCNACHVNNSYKKDLGPLGSVVAKPTGVTDPMGWLVVSPAAASCTSCHDSAKAIGHVTSFGSASFANRSQKDSLMTQETCDDCHAPGGFKGVDLVHGQK